jgi:hypothetical protein
MKIKELINYDFWTKSKGKVRVISICLSKSKGYSYFNRIRAFEDFKEQDLKSLSFGIRTINASIEFKNFESKLSFKGFQSINFLDKFIQTS